MVLDTITLTVEMTVVVTVVVTKRVEGALTYAHGNLTASKLTPSFAKGLPS
jgi:hypothetical protein